MKDKKDDDSIFDFLNKSFPKNAPPLFQEDPEDAYFLPLDSQFANFINESFIPKIKFKAVELDFFNTVGCIYIYDKYCDIDSSLNIEYFLCNRLHEYFGIHIEDQEDYWNPFVSKVAEFKRFIIIRDNKVLEMKNNIIVMLIGGYIDRQLAKLSYIEDSDILNIQKSVSKALKEEFINYRDIPV